MWDTWSSAFGRWHATSAKAATEHARRLRIPMIDLGVESVTVRRREILMVRLASGDLNEVAVAVPDDDVRRLIGSLCIWPVGNDT
jgi:hypothetical protein